MKKSIIIGGRGDLPSLFREASKEFSYGYGGHYSFDGLPFSYGYDDYEDVYPYGASSHSSHGSNIDDYCYIEFYHDCKGILSRESVVEIFYSLSEFDAYCEKNGIVVPFHASTMLLSNYEVYCTLDPSVEVEGVSSLICNSTKEGLYNECKSLIPSYFDDGR